VDVSFALPLESLTSSRSPPNWDISSDVKSPETGRADGSPLSTAACSFNRRTRSAERLDFFLGGWGEEEVASWLRHAALVVGLGVGLVGGLGARCLPFRGAP
jgi:hypothetical protein